VNDNERNSQRPTYPPKQNKAEGVIMLKLQTNVERMTEDMSGNKPNRKT